MKSEKDKIELNKSKSLRDFKNLIGQPNHFLITILVGLNGVKEEVVTKRDTFSTSWNPKNVQASADRSREFAIKSALSWSIDALDAYFIMTQREPKLIQNENFQNDFGKAKQSVFKRLEVFENYFSVEEKVVTKCLVELAITWRNRMVHHFADNELNHKTRNNLLENYEFIKQNYSNLDIKDLLLHFDSSTNNAPKFKEVASLISAIINYVYTVDKEIINKLDLEKYTLDVVKHYIVNQCKLRKNRKNSSSKPEIVLKEIWMDDKERKIYSILSQYGFGYNKTGKRVEFLESFFNLTYEEIKEKLNINKE